MAAGKKSFVLYSDLLVSIGHLTNEEKGILFNHLLEYVNDKSPVLEDRLLITAWKPIEMQLKRDLKKFEEIKVKRSEAGKKSAETKAQQNSTNSTLVESVQHPSTNSTDNDNDNDNVNVNVNDNVINGKIPAWEDFLAYALQNKPLVSKLDLKLKYDAWVVNGWKKQSKDGKLVKIANWKGTLLNTLPYIANTPAPQVRRVSL